MRFSVLLVALLFAGVMTVGCKCGSKTAGDSGVVASASKCAEGKAKCKAKANKCADCKSGQKCAKCKAHAAAKGAGDKAKDAGYKAKAAAQDASDAVKAEMPK